jgi:phage terminase large subunit
MENDPEYVKYLESLPSTLRKQWLEGSWEDFDVDGAIFGNEMRDVKQQGRITRIPYDPLLPVDTWWDLGHRDANVIWFVQQVGREIRLIDMYQVQFSNMRAILQELKDRADVLGYKYGTFVLPHDINVHEYSTGVTRAENFVTYMRELFDREMRLDVDYKIAPAMKYGNSDGIDAARDLLPYCWFDAEKCAEGIYAMKSYHREKIDGTNVYKDKPEHDEFSHAATAFMYGAMMTKTFIQRRQETEKTALKAKARIMLPKRQGVNYLTGEML